MTGFRVHPGGAQGLTRVRPDLTTLGKVIGGGLPVGAYGGRRDVMSMVAPAGPVYQAGTLSGNPLAMAAGLATLALLEQPDVWDGIAARAREVEALLVDAARTARVPLQVQRAGTMLTAFFSETPVTNWSDARRCDTAMFGRVFRALLDEGVYWVPSQFEAAFLSAAHDDAALASTATAVHRAFQRARDA